MATDQDYGAAGLEALEYSALGIQARLKAETRQAAVDAALAEQMKQVKAISGDAG